MINFLTEITATHLLDNSARKSDVISTDARLTRFRRITRNFRIFCFAKVLLRKNQNISGVITEVSSLFFAGKLRWKPRCYYNKRYRWTRFQRNNENLPHVFRLRTPLRNQMLF